MKDLEKYIYAYALKNAIEFDKTDAGRILPKLFSHGLDKKDIQKVMPQILQISKEINSLSKEKKEKLFEKYSSLIPEKEEKEKDLPELDLKGQKAVVTRLAPEPSKYLHIGHALSFLLNYIYAKRYKGKCLLRFEDTNPEKINQEYINADLDDIENYLGIKPDGIRYISDDMPILYDYAEKLIKKDKAYMCFCEREKMQDLRHKGLPCSCRAKPQKDNLKEWNEFIKGKYAKGEAVLRIKGDMKSQNHVMRDSVIFRTITHPHYKYKNKYHVWPMYDFYNPIEDSLMNITLILRSNEFDLRVELQDYIKDILGLKKQTIIQYGRFNVMNYTTKGREIRELIESHELIGWDDPRLVTLKALKRRGITKEALYELVKQIGLSKHEVNLDFDMIASINRKLIDPVTLRYSFAPNPVKLKISNAPKIKEVEVPIHPDKKGKRKIQVGDICISKDDLTKYKGKEVRLLHLYNIKLSGNEKADFTSLENKDIPKINWVSSPLKAQILMPDGKTIEGLAEPSIKNLKKGEIIQFERFGFARFDSKTKDSFKFWFSHH
jgi:glutamyl-tRNA synthetase